MPPAALDHLAVTAPSLEAGAAFVRGALGVAPEPGGEHPRMGTHNLLLRLGEATYLEVIAANPAAAAPARPRWFALDTVGPGSSPALAAWVARTTDIRASVAAASEPLGDIEPMSRGALEWLITIRADGALPLGGAAPALIEWHCGTHPASRLKDQGLALAGLEILHPEPERVARLLRSLALEAPVTVRPAPAGASAQLISHIDTPQGRRSLSVPPPAGAR